MTTINKILVYLNPLTRLGEKQYSIIFPGILTLTVALALEYYYRFIVHNPKLVRTPGVLIFLGLIIYFSFRDGIRGGITAASITIAYYFFITISQYTTPQAFVNDFETTLAFTDLYLLLAIIIGGLKQ